MKKYLTSVGKKSLKALNCEIEAKTKNRVLKKFVNLIKVNKLKIIYYLNLEYMLLRFV